MKRLLIGLLALISVSAFADITLQEGDSFSLMVTKDIQLNRNQSYYRFRDNNPKYGCELEFNTDSERYDRVIKAGTVYSFVFKKLVRNAYYSTEFLGQNTSIFSVVSSVTGEIGYSNLSSLTNFINQRCDGIKFESYLPAGHEGSVIVE